MAKIEVAADMSGTTRYLIHGSPRALPPVTRRDLTTAWEAARAAAIAPNGFGALRAFRFARADGTTTDLALADRDARCWAQALDRRASLGTLHGLSICLRLLALIALLAEAPWARHLMSLRRTGAELDAGLLRLAAEAKLTEEARFDHEAFRISLSPRLP